MDKTGIMGIYSLYDHLPACRAYNSIITEIKKPAKTIIQLLFLNLDTNTKGRDRRVIITASPMEARKRIASVIAPPI